MAAILMLLAIVPVACPAANQAAMPPTRGAQVCGGFPPVDGGPHDYRNVRDWRLERVEKFHFTPEVERLTKGQSSNNIGEDLAFTLRHFPNHHRAMLAMIRLSAKLGTDKPPGAPYDVDCWMDRAVRFTPDDTVARMIYVQYLQQRGRQADAMAHLDAVVGQAGDNAFSHYNAGLLYLEMKQYDRARAQAHRAAALGMERPGLQQRLQAAGQWKAPESVTNLPVPNDAAGGASPASAQAPAGASSAPQGPVRP